MYTSCPPFCTDTECQLTGRDNCWSRLNCSIQLYIFIPNVSVTFPPVNEPGAIFSKVLDHALWPPVAQKISRGSGCMLGLAARMVSTFHWVRMAATNGSSQLCVAKMGRLA